VIFVPSPEALSTSMVPPATSARSRIIVSP
jgi:hypothetical protein